MKEQDIRWQQRFSNYPKALLKLKQTDQSGLDRTHRTEKNYFLSKKYLI